MRILSLLIIFILIFGCAAQTEQKTNTPASQPTPEPAKQPIPEPSPSPSTQPVPTPVSIPTPVPQPQPAPNPQPVPGSIAAPRPIEQPKLINEKTLSERLQEANDRLHTQGSGPQIRNDFPDIQLVYTDKAEGTGFPQMILPFKYYYSKEADKTFNICNIDLTVFICKGKLDRLITKNDIDSKRCEATPIYLSDSRLGGRGGQGYGYGYGYGN